MACPTFEQTAQMIFYMSAATTHAFVNIAGLLILPIVIGH